MTAMVYRLTCHQLLPSHLVTWASTAKCLCSVLGVSCLAMTADQQTMNVLAPWRIRRHVKVLFSAAAAQSSTCPASEQDVCNLQQLCSLSLHFLLAYLCKEPPHALVLSTGLTA